MEGAWKGWNVEMELRISVILIGPDYENIASCIILHQILWRLYGTHMAPMIHGHTTVAFFDELFLVCPAHVIRSCHRSFDVRRLPD